MENETETKQSKVKHHWRASFVVKNLQVCQNCGQERRKHKDGKFYTNPEFKTYCSTDEIETRQTF